MIVRNTFDWKTIKKLENSVTEKARAGEIGFAKSRHVKAGNYTDKRRTLWVHAKHFRLMVFVAESGNIALTKAFDNIVPNGIIKFHDRYLAEEEMMTLVLADE